jgi:hypothetical protein
MLSPEQFEGLAKEIHPQGPDDGGFTINTQTGHRPSSGYAVALAGAEEDRPLERTSGPSIAAYAQRNHALLSQRGVHLGGWGPPEGEPRHGRGILDTTRVINNRTQAAHEMVMENQDAMMHLDFSDKGEGAVDNVYKRKPTSYEEPAGFNRPQFERDVANLYRSRAGRRPLAADEAIRKTMARPVPGTSGRS